MGWMANLYLAKKAAAETLPETLPEARDADGAQFIEPYVAEMEAVQDMDSVPDEDSCSDDFWISEDWQEEWEERAAIMEHGGGLPAEQAQAEAAISQVRVKHPEGAVAAGWLKEVRDVRQGRLPEWESWSTACRANWAVQMLDMARAGDFLKFAGRGGRAWLEGLVRQLPPSDLAGANAEASRVRPRGGRPPPAGCKGMCHRAHA